MVERDRTAASALRTLRDKLKADMIRIHVGDAMQVTERMDASRFDLILLDPPFGQGWLPRLWPLLPGILTENGLVYVEAETPSNRPDSRSCARTRPAPSTTICWNLLHCANRSIIRASEDGVHHL